MEPTKIKKSDKYVVKICAVCHKHEYQGKFKDSVSAEESALDMIEQRFKDAKEVSLYIPPHKENPGLNIEAEAIVDKKIVPVIISYTLCPKCSRQDSQSFNGILQLRNPTEEMVSFVETEIRKGADRGCYCNKETEVTNGIDYNITSAQFTRELGRKLRDKYGGELIETAKLVSRSKETSKDLFRITMMFRYPKFNKGDIIDYKGRQVRVLNLSGKVYVQDIKSSKKQQINYKDLR